MKIRNYYKCFSEEELKEGAELLLSGETSSGKEELSENNLKNILTYHQTSPNDLLPAYEENRFFRIFSTTAPENMARSRKKETYQAELYFDRKKELILSTHCNCTSFQKDQYGCPHLAAALTSFYMEEEGQDFFRDSRLENDLRELAGVEDPFAPGVMKRTDSCFRDYLQNSLQENALPVWQEKDENGVKTEPQLHCECLITEEDGFWYLELKAGAQRSYVIKNIPSFLRSYQNGEMQSFGKGEYILCEENFQKSSLPLMNFLLNHKFSYSAPYLAGRSQDHRFIKLDDYEQADFLEQFDGSIINFSDGGRIPVDLDRKGLMVTLRKKSYGASVKLNFLKIMCNVAGTLYLKDQTGIFRVFVSMEESRLLCSLLASTKEAFIREADIPVFLTNLLPFFESAGTVTFKRFTPEQYSKESPEFVLYLDLEDKETVSARPHCLYKDPDADYLLFDNQSGIRRRNSPAEKKFAERLTDLFDTYDRESGKLSANRNEEELFRFLQETIPDLKKECTIYISDRLKRIKVRKLPSVSVEVSRQSSSLLMSIHADSISQEEMAEILGAYSLKKKYFRLKDGSFFDFKDADGEGWDTLSDLYRHYGKKDPKLFSVPLYRALYLDELLNDREGLVLNGDEHYKNILASAKGGGKNPVSLPASLKEILRPYQAEGFRWISRLKEMGFGGILADDMGLGKTLQILAFLLSEKEKTTAPSLIVCPASLVYNWKKELERFTPQLSSVTIVGNQAERIKKIGESREIEVWITSYDLLKRDIAFYEDITFAHEIVDEAQYIKNQSTQAAKAVRGIRADFRMALTGTPIENRLGELWSIMDYLMPGFLYPYTRFQKEFEAPITLDKDQQSLSRLRCMTHPFILRRLKSDVLKELPEKQEETVSVQLEGEQLKIYDAYAARLKTSLEKTSDKDFGSSKIQVLAEITRLRQICCDPALVLESYHGESAKLEACMELIKQAVEGEHKLLLFSQFTSMLDIICDRLSREKLPYYRIDGSTSKEKRMEMVDNFAGDDVSVFCISLKAGGTGLNLTAADIVIHYDPWWNQAAQNQATDRTHRIGQTNKVTVYELVAKNTLEEKIQEIKKEKTQLMTDVLSGDTISSSDFNRKELLELL